MPFIIIIIKPGKCQQMYGYIPILHYFAAFMVDLHGYGSNWEQFRTIDRSIKFLSTVCREKASENKMIRAGSSGPYFLGHTIIVPFVYQQLKRFLITSEVGENELQK